MTPKMTKKRLSIKKRGLVTTVQPKPEFSRTCCFRVVLGINEDCLNAKSHQNRWSRFWDMDKKHQKCTKKGGFPPLVATQDLKKNFFQRKIHWGSEMGEPPIFGAFLMFFVHISNMALTILI